MKMIREISILALILACTSACTKDGAFRSQSGISSKTAGSSAAQLAGATGAQGNGEFYGGKPLPGRYIRQIPGSLCKPKNDVVAELNVSETSIKSTSLNSSDCSVTTRELSLQDIEFAEYQPDLVGQFQGIYAREESVKNGLQDEVWCRSPDSNVKTGFDVVIKADYKKRTFEAYVTSASKNSAGEIVRQEYTPIPMDRDLDMFEKARYKYGDVVELDIRTDSVDEWRGTMKGEFRYRLNGFKLDTLLDCRLGGELDPAE
jgi:hypothetical protein